MGVIKNWHYDPGLPDYMPAIDQWSDPRTPAWRCSVDAANPAIKSIQEWLNDNCLSAEFSIRFNDGCPHMYITINNEHDALLFFMRWS